MSPRRHPPARARRALLAAAFVVAAVPGVVATGAPAAAQGTGDGSLLAFGSAAFHGAPVVDSLRSPLVGMAATPTGGGYWLVASDGGIFSFGQAGFRGSTGALKLVSPIVGMAS